MIENLRHPKKAPPDRYAEPVPSHGRQVDIYISLHLATATGVDKLFRHFSYDSEAVVFEPVDQGTNRGKSLILDNGRVVIGTHEFAATLKSASSRL
jgi:hypothetical protein